MAKKNDIEEISLDIANYWTLNYFLIETNQNCGPLVAFDWKKDKDEDEYYLAEINTNIDLDDLELDNFKFDTFVDFLKKYNFTLVLGLRNIAYDHNPSAEWTDTIKEILKLKEIDYDEYIVDNWPARIPSFDVPDNVFILRYSYDEYSEIDVLAASNTLFRDFIKKSDWEKYYRNTDRESKFNSFHSDKFLFAPVWDAGREIWVVEKLRVIVLCSDVESLILHDGFEKDAIEVSIPKNIQRLDK